MLDIIFIILHYNVAEVTVNCVKSIVSNLDSKKYRIIIGPTQYKKLSGDDYILDAALANSFSANVEAFQDFLKATGFLKELSDATSIVVNPYEELKGDICNI